MSVAVITPPAALVSLALAKKHCRVDAANIDDDDLLTLHIAAACAGIDGPGGWLERAIGEQTLELRQDEFNQGDWRCGAGYAWGGGWTDWERWPFERIKLPYPPLISIVSITYEDGTGADQVLTSSGWKATEDGIEPTWGMTWPSGRTDAQAVRIRYLAGYPDIPPASDAAAGTLPTSGAPAPIQAAALLMVGSLYANREQDVIDARAVVAENPAVERLLAPYRVWA